MRQKCSLLQMRLFRQGREEQGENLQNYFLLRIFKSPFDGPIFPQRAMRQAERNFFIEVQAEYLLKLELLAQGREFEPDTPPERLIFRDCADLSEEDLEVEFVELVETDPTKISDRQKIQRIGEEFLEAI